MAAGAGGVWIGDSRAEKLVRLDPAYPSTSRSIELGRSRGYFTIVNPVAVGHGAVWVMGANGEIARVDPRRRRVADTIPVGNSPASIATGAGGVWVADDNDNSVTRIDPAGANAVMAPIAVGQGPSAIAVGEGAVWVANTQDDTVSRIDPGTAAVTETIPVGARPTGIAAAGGAVWVANGLGGTVSRIDPEANRVEATIEVGEAPHGLTVAHDLVWVTVQAGAEAPKAPSLGRGEDVARVVVNEPVGYADPADGSAGTEVGFATCAPLYNYPDLPFPEGSRLVPDVAAGEPLVSDDGRTYRFRIRPGFRFSPPSNEPVTAAAFQRTLERRLSPVISSGDDFGLGDIVGADDYIAGRARTLKGVDAHDRTLVIRLAKPVPNLPARLEGPQWGFCAVPPGTPRNEVVVNDPVSSAGPYYVDSYVPFRSLVLRRNPNYGGDRPQGLEEIRVDYGISVERGVEEVEEGRADHIALQPGFGTLPASTQVADRLERLYGPDSEAAAEPAASSCSRRGGRPWIPTSSTPTAARSRTRVCAGR